MIKIDSYKKLVIVAMMVFLLSISLFSATLFVSAQAGSKLVTPDNIVLVDDLDNLTKTESLPWSNITDVNPIGSYSFMITPLVNGSGTFYQAINGTDNKPVVSWTSTNVSSIMTNAFQSNTHVHFSAGTYPIAYNVSLGGIHNLWISGEKTATKFVKAATGINMLNLGNYYVAGDQRPASNDAYNITISDILWDGNTTTTAGPPYGINNGIFICGGTNIQIIDNTFQYFGNHAIVITETGNATGVNVARNFFYKNNYYDVAFAGTVGGNHAENNLFSYSHGLQTWTENSIIGNDFYYLTKGIVIYGVGNEVSNNHFTHNSASDIDTEAGADSNIISDNTINTPSATSSVVIQSHYNSITNNKIIAEAGSNGFVFIGANFNFMQGNTIKGGSGSSNSVYVHSGLNNTVTGNYLYSCIRGLTDSAIGTVFTNNYLYTVTNVNTTSGAGYIYHNNVVNGVWCETGFAP